jgi:hypothetical protein
VKASRRVWWLGCAVLLMSNAGLALAQEAPIDAPPLRKKTVITDAYAATGLDTGGLRLFPSLEIGAVLTSNVRSAPSNAQGDVGLELKPSLRFESEWSRHSWTGSATGDWVHYNKVDDLSTLTGNLESNYRLDIRHTTHADFAANYRLSNTGVASSQVPNTAIGPRRDQSFGLAAGLTHDFGGLEGSVKTALARSLYEDVELSGGGSEDNGDRNYWAPSLSLRAALTDNSMAFKPFAEITYAPRFHDQETDRNGLKRDSQGLEISAGVALNRGPIWDGEVALTYLVRNYADTTLATAQALGATGRLVWKPTEITTLEATAGVTIDETSSAAIAASRSWNGGLTLTQAMRDYLDFNAGLGFTLQDTGTQFDKTTTAKLGLDWKLNPNMTAGVTYQGLWFKSGSASGDYNDQRLMTSIVLKR